MLRSPINVLLYLVMLLAATSCCRSGCEVWQDTKTAGHYMSRGLRSLFGQNQDSRQIHSAEEFIGPSHLDYISLRDEDQSQQVHLESAPQPKITPGDPGSGLPGIDGFKDPRSAELKAVFQHVHFDTNDHIIRGSDNLMILQNISDYLKSHPNAYVFVEGHCDQRGPAAFNLALGARRAGMVRTSLIQAGVDRDRVFTISYGKERLLKAENEPEAWAVNRRSQFKLYFRK